MSEASNRPFVTPTRRSTLWTLACRVVPPCERLDDAARDEMMRIIDRAITGRPASMQRQLGLFLTVIRVVARLRSLRRIEKLKPDDVERLCRWLERNPISLVRKGFWGVKALILMGYYGQGPIRAAIGYRPELRGGGLEG